MDPIDDKGLLSSSEESDSASQKPESMDVEEKVSKAEEQKPEQPSIQNDGVPPTTSADVQSTSQDASVNDPPTKQASSIDHSSNKRKKIRVVSHLQKSTSHKMFGAKGVDRCLLCSFVGKGPILNIHTRRHYSRFFCPCGYSEPTKSLLAQHMHSAKRNGVPNHQEASECYEVDVPSFEKFKEERGLKDIIFGDLWKITEP